MEESANYIDRPTDYLYFEALLLFAKGKTKAAMLKMEEAIQI